MHNNLHAPGFLAMYVTEDADGSSQVIEFLNTTTGYGSLDAATVFQTPGERSFVDHVWIAQSEILPTLLNLVDDRKGLPAIADFKGLQLNEAGLPCAFEHQLSCGDCNHDWVQVFPHRMEEFRCPKCRSLVRPSSNEVRWIGPSHPVLQTLWTVLPDELDDEINLPNGLRMLIEVDSVIVLDKAGNRVQASVEEDRLKLMFRHHATGDALTVRSGPDGIVVELGGSEASMYRRRDD